LVFIFMTGQEPTERVARANRQRRFINIYGTYELRLMLHWLFCMVETGLARRAAPKQFVAREAEHIHH
jgi:hypothetical protein